MKEGGNMPTDTQDRHGNWVPAKEEPYYPSIWERIGHWFGVHQWTYDKTECVMCGKKKA